MELLKASLFSRNWRDPWIFTPFKYNPREFPSMGLHKSEYTSVLTEGLDHFRSRYGPNIIRSSVGLEYGPQALTGFFVMV